MRYITLLLLLITTLFITCCEEQTTPRVKAPKDGYTNYDFNVQPNFSPNAPYLWGYSMLEIESKYNDSSIFTANHPLDIGRHALYLLIEQEDTTAIDWKLYLEHLDNYKYRVQTDSLVSYAYGFNYKEFEAGEWWSAMANSVIALSYLEGFSQSQDSAYYEEYELAKNSLFASTAEKGCRLTLSDSALWYLEYASKESTIDNGNFVLNGFLFALLGVKQMADLTQDQELYQYYQQGVNAFKGYAEEYYYRTNDWTYYKLNPITIEPPHYAVFDILLMRSLLTIDSTNAELWKTEISRRANIISRAYPVFKTSDSTLYFSMVGPPHPYWVDTYPLQLDVRYNDGAMQSYYMKNPRDHSMSLEERALHTITIDSEKLVDRVDVYAQYGSVSILLYTTDSLQLTTNKEVFKSEFKKRSDNISQEGIDWTLLDTSTSNFQIHTWLPASEISRGKYYGFTFNPSFEVSAIRLLLLPKSGEGAERYYQVPVTNQDNFILFHLTGFKNIDQVLIQDSTEVEMRLMVYPKSVLESTMEFTLDSLYVFNSIYDANAFMIKNELVLPEKGKRGNIY